MTPEELNRIALFRQETIHSRQRIITLLGLQAANHGLSLNQTQLEDLADISITAELCYSLRIDAVIFTMDQAGKFRNGRLTPEPPGRKQPDRHGDAVGFVFAGYKLGFEPVAMFQFDRLIGGEQQEPVAKFYGGDRNDHELVWLMAGEVKQLLERKWRDE